MRFKSIFWLFNGIVLLVLIFFAVGSLILFGPDYATDYWGTMWMITALFIILIGILDFYFIWNWQLFNLMEKEDWPALIALLEEYIYGKRQLKKHYANLLINTALSVSNFDAVKKLEIEVRHRKPKMFRSLGVSLGIPLLLEQNHQAISNYYKPLADDEKTLRRDWAQWCYASASGSERNSELIKLLESNDLSLRLLSIEVLDQRFDTLKNEEMEVMNKTKAELRPILTGTKGMHSLQHSRENHLIAIVLSSRINTARDILLATV